MICDIDAIVAAGGRGLRLGSNGPKSLIQVAGESFLVRTVRALTTAGIRRIVVCVDDPHWLDVAQRQLTSFCGVEVVGVPNYYSSTIELVSAQAASVSERFLFAYGHAPRPATHLSRLMRKTRGIVATAVSASSKRRPVYWQGRFLEPPYTLRGADLVPGIGSWENFFEGHACSVSAVSIDGPPEFNYPDECFAYQQYVQGWGSV